MTYEYIIHNEHYYVPRAPSFCVARERQETFFEELGVEPLIVSPHEWELLSSKMEVLLLEHSDV
jgi:hypothetical protein